MDTFAIQTYNLTRKFGSHRVLDRLTLNVPTGAIFGLLGPRGAGKTTVLRLLSGLLPPTSGAAHILGYDVHTQAGAIRAHTGVLFGQVRMENTLSGELILANHEHGSALASPERQSRNQALLTHFGLWTRRQEPVGTWSLDMQRRLAIVRILLHRPKLLFLDEPTLGLDALAASALRQDIADFVRSDGITVFLTTQSLAEATQFCDIAGILHRGKLLATADPGDLQACGGVRVEIRGRGFTPDLVALLGRRPQVTSVRADGNHLWIDLLPPPRRYPTDQLDTAPLVTLLIESGAEIEEVHKEAIRFDELCWTFAPEV